MLQLFLPDGILEYFDITGHELVEGGIIIFLDEKNILPPELSADEYETKDFLPARSVKDFPIRGKGVLLKIARRRWRHKTTGKTVTRQWDGLIESGRVTKEFGAFLKEIGRISL